MNSVKIALGIVLGASTMLAISEMKSDAKHVFKQITKHENGVIHGNEEFVVLLQNLEAYESSAPISFQYILKAVVCLLQAPDAPTVQQIREIESQSIILNWAIRSLYKKSMERTHADKTVREDFLENSESIQAKFQDCMSNLHQN